MATISTNGVSFFGASRSKAALRTMKDRRRNISPQAGHALEILGHAIEYLADELVHEGKPVDAREPQLQAMQMLMALNRQVYYECPFVPTFSERLRAFLHLAPRVGSR